MITRRCSTNFACAFSKLLSSVMANLPGSSQAELVAQSRSAQAPASPAFQLHGQMIATTTFTAARAVDKALEHLRFGHGAKQHDGLAGRAPRHGGIRAVPDDPNGARPSLASTLDIFVAFGHFTPGRPRMAQFQYNV